MSKRWIFRRLPTSLVWLTSIVSVVITYIVSYFLIGSLGDGTLWWKLSTVITCGTLGAIIPELVKVFTSTQSRHVRRGGRIGDAEGGASLGILSGFVGRELQCLLAGICHRSPHVHRISCQHHGTGCFDAGPGQLRLWPCGFRVPWNGTGHHRRRFLWACDGQRSVGIREFSDRADPGIKQQIKKRMALKSISRPPNNCWKQKCTRRQHFQPPRSRFYWNGGGRSYDHDFFDY